MTPAAVKEISPSCGQFGPGVIGKKEFDKEQKVVKKGEQIFGPGVLVHPSKPQNVGKNIPSPATQLGVPKEEIEGMSAEAVKKAVKENPGLVRPLYDAEIGRKDGIRKGVLVAMRAKAGDDKQLVALIDHSLEALG